ncbi:L,D-transpeptidase family protein [Clostridium sp. MCC353]|uniref:L,D-transpeptidase family protein n=1 Tax=Clostridium sp. MCC353 TaxID=2592646 RepID=UPI001C039782|nr:L,D-transpeptidase family protein [Clostridium sp. MCC353]MBT9779845.1 L,D-transpeptidase family protein [Clostridium sp. MCC353]
MRKTIITALLAASVSLAGLVGTAFADEILEPVVEAAAVGNLKAADTAEQLILVEASGLEKVKVSYYRKASSEKGPGMRKNWTEVFTVPGVYGRNGGTADKKEGDGKTPLGTYQFTMAFGLKEDPGSVLDYHEIKSGDYWVDDPESVYYNKLVNTNETKKVWNSAEDMSAAAPFYNYGLVLNYNTECIPGKGSAIFIHCTQSAADTGSAGCIRIPEEQMKQLVQSVDGKTNIVIVSDLSQLEYE